MRYVRSTVAYIFIFAFLVIPAFALVSSPTPALAQEDEGYSLLAPLPGLEPGDVENSENPLGEYLKIVYRLGVSLAILFAVVALIFGGVQYMTSDSVTTKGSAKDTITAALVGLLLAVASYVLLFLIGGAGTVTVSSDFGNLPWIDPPPGEGQPPPDFDTFCTGDITNTETNIPVDNVSDLPLCPGSHPDSVRNWDGVNFTQDEYIDFYRGPGDASVCQIVGGEVQVGTTDEIPFRLTVDMSECEAAADELFEPGTPEQCFQDELRRPSTTEQRQMFCGNADITEDISGDSFDNDAHYSVEFAADSLNDQSQSPGGCYLLSEDEDVDEVEAVISEECSDVGGRLVFDYSNVSSEFGSYYCVTETDEATCEEEATSPFPVIEELDLSDAEWDEAFCDANPETLDSIPAFEGAGEEARKELEELFEQFANEMGTRAYQTSGYYNDEEYIESQGKYHAGIDIRTNRDDVSTISSPVSGEVQIMRNMDTGCYAEGSGRTANDKVAIVDENGRAWILTHIELGDVSTGDPIEAGDAIGFKSDNPGYNSGGGTCDTFKPHLHLETFENDKCIFGENDSDNWSTKNGCPNSGFLDVSPENLDLIKDKTMCPLQAYWETITGES
ncbi:MAG: peptidoglycan DD-metalloendopeptidase family protein [Candidatus Campbellbacteria bacterium]|nr:peptidoglycan DD-metalloendopeptidase family protein [Candidatus Campbellbacteria bacterium]